MVRILFALLVGLGSLLSSVQAQTLLVLGDSLSAGYQMQEKQSWPALLEQKWQNEGGEHTLINASVGGETTQEGWRACPPCWSSISQTGC